MKWERSKFTVDRSGGHHLSDSYRDKCKSNQASNLTFSLRNVGHGGGGVQVKAHNEKTTS